MTLTIDLPDERNAALAAKALAHGMSAEVISGLVRSDRHPAK
jgi:hypothetical protein